MIRANPVRTGPIARGTTFTRGSAAAKKMSGTCQTYIIVITRTMFESDEGLGIIVRFLGRSRRAIMVT